MVIIQGLEFSFQRRRYGRVTYTWASVRKGDEWINLGDPWPCITPKHSELIEAARVKGVYRV